MCRMGGMMRLLPLLSALLLFAPACKSVPEKDPENQITAVVDEEFARFRPVALAVLKVEAPAYQMRNEVRRGTARQLLDRRKYSPIKLDVVDARTDGQGKFTPGSDLEVDATVVVKVTRWVPVRGKSMYRCDAEMVMTHSSGVELYRCTLRDGGIPVTDIADATSDYRNSANRIVTILIEDLPNCPPAPE